MEVLTFPDWMKPRAAAEFCGVSEATLRRLRQSGEGPVYVKLKRRFMYETSELKLWIQKNTVKPTRAQP